MKASKPTGIKILQITADGIGNVLGLGDDNRVYIWEYEDWKVWSNS